MLVCEEIVLTTNFSSKPHIRGVFCFIFIHIYSLHTQILYTDMLYTTLYTPLWAYGIKSTYVHPYPAQNESKQNPLTQRKVQLQPENKGGGVRCITGTHIVQQFFGFQLKYL